MTQNFRFTNRLKFCKEGEFKVILKAFASFLNTKKIYSVHDYYAFSMCPGGWEVFVKQDHQGKNGVFHVHSENLRDELFCIAETFCKTDEETLVGGYTPFSEGKITENEFQQNFKWEPNWPKSEPRLLSLKSYENHWKRINAPVSNPLITVYPD